MQFLINIFMVAIKRASYHLIMINKKIYLKLFFIVSLLYIPSLQAQTIPLSISSLTKDVDEWKYLTSPQGNDQPPQRYLSFIKKHVDWPLEKRILNRLEISLSNNDNIALLHSSCPLISLNKVETFNKCLPYISPEKITDTLHKFWVSNQHYKNTSITSLLNKNNFKPTANDEWTYFNSLINNKKYSEAKDRLLFLSTSYYPIAQSYLLLKENPYKNIERFISFSKKIQSSPLIFLTVIKNLEAHEQLEDAVIFWEHNIKKIQLTHIEDTKKINREENNLERNLIRNNLINLANKLPENTTFPIWSPLRQDSLFLHAYLDLYEKHPLLAEKRLMKIINYSNFPPLSLSTKSQAYFFLAQAQKDLNFSKKSYLSLTHASKFPATFYGQFSQACMINQKFLTINERTLSFIQKINSSFQNLPKIVKLSPKRNELLQAAIILNKKNNKEDATRFLILLILKTYSSSELKKIAELCNQLNIPKVAILAEKKLSERGETLYPEGFPKLIETQKNKTALPKSFIEALIRQESGGDNTSISPSGAYGLMQILPQTASFIINRHHLSYSPSTVNLFKTDHNVEIGSLLLDELYKQFNGDIPSILSAYNAGPGRTKKWLKIKDTLPVLSNHLCAYDEMRELSWILFIPSAETRNYIKNIEKNFSIYDLNYRRKNLIYKKRQFQKKLPQIIK